MEWSDPDAKAQIRAQDLEPDSSGGSKTRIRKGVAAELRVSIEDADMRHGRKSKSKRFNGYKRHVALDLDTDFILAGALLPANRPEAQAACAEGRHRSDQAPHCRGAHGLWLYHEPPCR